MKKLRGKIVRIVSHDGKSCECVGGEGKVVSAGKMYLCVRPFDENLRLGFYKASDLKYRNNKQVVMDE